MLLFLEFVVTLFKLLAVVLIVFAIFGVLPMATMLMIDETHKTKTWAKLHENDGRHRKGTGKDDTFIEEIVVRFRDGREMISTHRRIAHG